MRKHACAILPLVLLVSCSTLPSDNNLIANLNSHKSQFETVQKMAITENGVERIAPKFVRYVAQEDKTSQSALDEGRLKNYRKLFQEIGARGGVGISAGKVYFYMFDSGLSGSGVSKGIVWADTRPNKLEQNLDILAKRHVEPVIAWREVGDGWYLEYEAD